MGTIAGDSTNYKIYLSTTKTGAAGEETPTGDIVYFWAESYDKSPANLQQPKPSVAKSHYYPASKYNIEITLKNIHVAAQGAITATTEADAIDNFLYQKSIRRGSSGFYLFLYHEADAQYRKLDWNSTGTQIRPLFCAISGWNDHAEKGKLIVYPSMKFIKAG